MDQDQVRLREAVTAIQTGSSSLQSLSEAFPETWKAVMGDLNQRVKAKEIHTLGASRSHAVKALTSLDLVLKSQKTSELHNLVQAKMTILAIDQFADVLTGKVGIQAKLTDKALMKFAIIPRLLSGKPIDMRSFDKLWAWLKDPLWASGELQRQGFWSVPTLELLTRFKQHAADRTVLEIAAGRGLYVAGLDSLSVSVKGIDDGSWENESHILETAKPLMSSVDAVTALKQNNPSVVICSWPPPDNQFEQEIFATKSVQLYLAIVSKHTFASGNWRTYQSQKSFHCSTSEPLNQMLRPIELDQQVLIFRRN